MGLFFIVAFMSMLFFPIKECWVCREDHKERDRHTTKDILAALNGIKSENSNAMFTTEHVFDVYHALTASFEHLSVGDVSEDESDDDDIVNLLDSDDVQTLSKETEAYMANASFLHGLKTFAGDLKKEMTAMNAALHVGETSHFEGIIIDTGTNRASCMSLDQYKAYCHDFKAPMKIDRSEKRGLVGIGGSSRAIGTAVMPIPFSDLGIVIDVRFRVLDEKCPNLLCLKDMIQNGLDISLQKKFVSYKHKIQDLSFENDFLKHKWGKDEMVYSLYTEQELRRLHCVFGHLSVSALRNLLRRANPHEFNSDVMDALDDITRACRTCATYASKPRRFKISIGTDDLRFNHVVAVDVMYINGKAVLHVVDEATHYSAAVFLKNMSAAASRKALLRSWIRVYLGPPDYLRVDQGSNFVAQHFLNSAEAEEVIQVLQAPIESPSSMSHVERYHAPLRAAFVKIRDSLPHLETDADCLQLAVKSVNNTVGPEGLCPTLLVYGTLPRPPKRTPAETQLERARAMESASEAVQKEHAKRRISFALRHPSDPKAKEQESDLEKHPACAPVLMYHNKSKIWEGPFPFVSIQDNNTVVVQLPSGRKIFRSTVVKPAPHNTSEENWRVKDIDSIMYTHNSPDDRDSQGRTARGTNDHIEDTVSKESLSVMFGAGEQMHATSSKKHDFIESRRTEIQGLNERKTFEVVKKSSIPVGTRIYGTRWVDVIKVVDGKEVEKSRLVAQNYRDKAATEISTRSPTVSRMGQRVTVATAAIFPEHHSYIRDISQAYIQSDSMLERSVFLQPPPAMGLAKDEILLAKKSLYGVPESGLHWFMTYHTHHVDRLSMNHCRSDTCGLFRGTGENGNDAVTALQVDDAYGHGTKEFLDYEERESTRFQCKPRKLLVEGDYAFFNGCRISFSKKGVHGLYQKLKLRKLCKPTDQAEIQYIATCTRPDLCASVQLLANETTNPEPGTFKKMNKIIRWCRDTSDVGLKFVPLDRKSLRLMLFTDASFANAEHLKSQLGFVVVLVDGTGKGNILHYGSTTCERVARSVMATELHALVYGFDSAFMVKDMLSEILGQRIDIDAYVDSRTVFNVIAKQSATLEKRLQIDVNALRQSYSNGEIRYLAWIPGSQNIADGLTKGLIDSNHPLWKLMVENQISAYHKRNHFHECHPCNQEMCKCVCTHMPIMILHTLFSMKTSKHFTELQRSLTVSSPILASR